MKKLLTFLLFVGMAYAQNPIPPIEIKIPSQSGTILVNEPRFIQPTPYSSSGRTPKLSFELVNRTKSFWFLELRVREVGNCDGIPHKWEQTFSMVLGYTTAMEIKKTHSVLVTDLLGKVDNCVTDEIAFDLIRAKNNDVEILGQTGEIIDLAERRKIEEQTIMEAAKKRQAVEAATAEAEAKERAILKANCQKVYDSTANKKVSDLTVKEKQRVDACQTLGMYPPRYLIDLIK